MAFHFLVVASYSQRVLWYHLVATRSQWIEVSMLKCHPWIGMLAHTKYSRKYNRVQSHTYYIEVLIKSIYYNNMAEGHLTKNNYRSFEDKWVHPTPWQIWVQDNDLSHLNPRLKILQHETLQPCRSAHGICWQDHTIEQCWKIATTTCIFGWWRL